MGNCLKTQLKEVVNNNNLPIFNKVIITLENEVSNFSWDDIGVLIGGKENVTVTSKYGFKLSSGGEVLTSFTFTYVLSFATFYMVNTAGNTLEVESCYKCAGISIPYNSKIMDNGTIKGEGSANEYGIFKVFDYVPTEGYDYSNVINAKVVSVRGNLSQTIGDSSKFLLNNKNSLKLFICLDNDVNKTFTDFTEFTALQLINYNGSFTLDKCPVSLRSINLGYVSITGSIEGFVTNLRQSATSGIVQLQWASSSNVTYNDNGTNKTLAQYCSVIGHTGGLYLSWDASNISLSTSKPSGFVEPENVTQIMNSITMQ